MAVVQSRSRANLSAPKALVAKAAVLAAATTNPAIEGQEGRRTWCAGQIDAALRAVLAATKPLASSFRSVDTYLPARGRGDLC